MTPAEIEIAACQFVAAVGGLQVVRRSRGAVMPALPYAVVGLVSDVPDGPTDTITDDSPDALYTQHRSCRIQVDVVGTEAARTICQTVANLWVSDHPAARAAVAVGLAPSAPSDVRDTASLRGGSGLVTSASVDLRAFHRWTLYVPDGAGEEVTAVDVDLTGPPDVIGRLTLTALILDDGGPLLLSDGLTLDLGA